MAYVAVLALATLVPFQPELTGPPLTARLAEALSPRFVPADVVDAVRNLVLFAGWGLLWVGTTASRRALPAIRSATAVGAAVSVAIEAVQLFLPARNANVLDVLTNTAGAFFGAVAFVALTSLMAARRGQQSFVGMPASVLAGAYALAACVEAWLPPLRGATWGTVWGSPMARFRVAVERFDPGAPLALPLSDVLLFLPVGVFAVAALVEVRPGYRRAALVTTAAGALVFAVIEVARGFIGQPIELGAFLVHALAVAAGAAGAAQWLPPLTRMLRGRWRAVLLVVAYAVLILLWNWRPYLPETALAGVLEQLQPSRWLPLQAHRPRLDLFSVGNVLAAFLLFLPLGSLLAVWPLRRNGLLGTFLPAVYLAVVAELGQAFIAGRYFDSTDILVGAAAAAAGWIAVRRAGYNPYGQLLVKSTGFTGHAG